MKIWSALSFRRFVRTARPRPIRTRRPRLETLEDRLAPANVDITTFHYDNTLSGANTRETNLTPTNVNPAGFGRQITYPVDGYVYAQPLYKADLNIPGVGTRNVVFAATEHDSVYAFDADNRTAGPAGNGLYWQVSFIDNPGQPARRPGFTVTTMPATETFSGDIVPEIGITGTPVIDAANNIMYVVAKTKEVENATGVARYVHRMHALDIRTGSLLRTVTVGETIGLDVQNITNIVVTAANTGRDGDTGAPTGPGVVGGQLAYNARRALHRSALVLAPATPQHPNGLVYMDFASHGDNGPYRGWVIGYDPQTFELRQFYTTVLDARGAGIWQSGAPVAMDAGNNLYFANGNAFDVTIGGPRPVGPRNLTEAVVRLNTDPTTGQLRLGDWFIPHNWQFLDQVDADLGSGGTLVLPDAVGDLLPNGQRRKLVVETGKEGKIYLLDRDDLGRLSPNQAAETARIRDILIQGVAGVWGSPSFLQTGANEGLLVYHGSGDFLKAFLIRDGRFVRGPREGGAIARSDNFWGFPGGQPTFTSDGQGNVIIWELRSDAFNQRGPTILYAYRLDLPNNRLVEIFRSNQVGQRDVLGPATKFVTPVASNGKVFAGTANTLEIFGLFPQATATPAAPTILAAAADSPTQITLTFALPAAAEGAAATLLRVFRSTDGTTFTEIQVLGADRTTFTDTGLTPATRYFYRLRAENAFGVSDFSNTVDARTRIIAPVLGVFSVLRGQVDLFFSPVPEADAGYVLERSADGGATFETAAVIPAGQTFVSDTGLAPQRYLYRLIAVSSIGETSVSNVVTANLDPSPTVIDFSNGFANARDQLVFNGTPTPALVPTGSTLLVLTTGADFGQATSAVFNQRVSIGTFRTEFVFRLHDGTDPRADGFTFLIHSDPRGATAVGPAGGGLGFGPDTPNLAADPRGIRNSVAIKFDIFNNAGESPAGGTVVPNSTGLFTDGRSPTIRDSRLPGTPTPLLPDRSINLNTILTPEGFPVIQLNNQEPKRAIITYDGTVLTLRIEDRDDRTEAVEFTFEVDLRGIVGSDTAFVGFSGGTGGLTVVQDIASWVFEPGKDAVPSAPTDLVADPYSEPGSVRLTYRAFSPAADGFVIERSADGVTFAEVARVGPTTSTVDTPPLPGTYFYRVRAFNKAGDSFPSNVVRAAVLVPDAPTNLTARAGLNRVDLQWFVNSFSQTGFRVERALAGTGDFQEVGRTEPFDTTFTDTTAVGPNTYDYRVFAFNDFGDSLPTNTVTAQVAGVTRLLDFSSGFANPAGLMSNGNASFVGSTARLTPALNDQRGSIFSTSVVDITNWTSEFTFRISGGSSPRADGLTFVLQANSPTALGVGGGALGYQGIANSIAVKFDNFDGGTADPTDSTTGLFRNGEGPFGGIDTLPDGIDFRQPDDFRVTMDYNGTRLLVTIRNTRTDAVSTQTYTINLAAVLGSSVAFAGFTAATGGLNALHDVLNWRFESRA